MAEPSTPDQSGASSWPRQHAATLLPFAVPGLVLVATSASAAGYLVVRARSDDGFFALFEAQVWGLLVGILIAFAIVTAVALAQITHRLFFDVQYLIRPSARAAIGSGAVLVAVYLAALVVSNAIQQEIAPFRPVGQPIEVAQFATSLSLLVALPAVGSFAIIVHRSLAIARRGGVGMPRGLEELHRLRSNLDRSLFWLATLLSIGVVSTAGFQTAMRAACSGTDVDCGLILSPEHVWLYGAGLSGMLGMLFLPAELALRHAANVRLGPLPIPGSEGFAERLEARSQGARFLRVEGVLLERFQNALFIAGPLGASVLAAVTG
jgi:hypothetical protein